MKHFQGLGTTLSNKPVERMEQLQELMERAEKNEEELHKKILKHYGIDGTKEESERSKGTTETQ